MHKLKSTISLISIFALLKCAEIKKSRQCTKCRHRAWEPMNLHFAFEKKSLAICNHVFSKKNQNSAICFTILTWKRWEAEKLLRTLILKKQSKILQSKLEQCQQNVKKHFCFLTAKFAIINCNSKQRNHFLLSRKSLSNLWLLHCSIFKFRSCKIENWKSHFQKWKWELK